MTDFSVRIKKLPKVTRLDELEKFTQDLTIHIEEVVSLEDVIFAS